MSSGLRLYQSPGKRMLVNCVSVDTQFGIIIIMLVNCVSVDTQFVR